VSTEFLKQSKHELDSARGDDISAVIEYECSLQVQLAKYYGITYPCMLLTCLWRTFEDSDIACGSGEITPVETGK